jgi:hypothetical protein
MQHSNAIFVVCGCAAASTFDSLDLMPFYQYQKTFLDAHRIISLHSSLPARLQRCNQSKTLPNHHHVVSISQPHTQKRCEKSSFAFCNCKTND